MRTAAGVVLLAVLAAGCRTTPHAGTPSGGQPGCGLVQRSAVVGLLGEDVEARMTGSVAALRQRHTRVVCRTTVPGHPERYVTVVADHHPAPFQLFVRRQPYLVHITIGRSDRNWGGDPEVALAMSRALAQELGVEEARGEG